MKETLKVSSVIAGWIDEDYRNGKGGLKSLEVVVKDNLDSDIILFPGGFIMENRNRNKLKSKIEKTAEDYKGVLILGFDRYSNHGRISASVLMVYNGRSSTFKQTCMKNKDEVKNFNPEKRFFDYQGLNIVPISCGELFNQEFREKMFKYKTPDLLLGCVHYGQGFQNEPYRARLNQHSNIASFYTFHTNVINPNKLKISRFSGAPINEVVEYKELNLSVIKYEFDPTKRHNIKITRKIKLNPS